MAVQRTRLSVTILLACIAFLFATSSHAGQVNYTYDDAGRLVKADHGAAGVIEYTYDDAGNRVSRKVLVAPPSCAGDCNGGSDVTVDELVQCVNIALGNQPVSACPACDTSGDGTVTVDELVKAVNAALNGCPVTSQLKQSN